MEYQEICQMIENIHSEINPSCNEEFKAALKDAEKALNNLKKFY